MTIARTYRGRVNLTLDDASLVALPVFRELDKFLGSAGGGLFEQGDLNGSIVNRQVVIESATLMGRLAQLHVSGTVGFDGQLNLEVLVNTNQVIPQAGSALASVIPGMGGRNSQATLGVSNYLSNRLLKFRVTGTLKSPSVNLDPGVAVAGSAVGFFSGVLKLPMGLVK
ncbi:MAG: AsmA-like C-terminal region-containing protein [Planctomycetia bacterium]|nr:AsmA-like C-terminal region-containing protein [Planctomycetia bacterium]